MSSEPIVLDAELREHVLYLIDNSRLKEGYNSGDAVAIELTEEDVANGVPSNAMSCALAMSIRRRFPDCFWACVRHSHIEVEFKIGEDEHGDSIFRTLFLWHTQKSFVAMQEFDETRNPKLGTYSLPVAAG